MTVVTVTSTTQRDGSEVIRIFGQLTDTGTSADPEYAVLQLIRIDVAGIAQGTRAIVFSTLTELLYFFMTANLLYEISISNRKE